MLIGGIAEDAMRKVAATKDDILRPGRNAHRKWLEMRCELQFTWQELPLAMIHINRITNFRCKGFQKKPIQRAAKFKLGPRTRKAQVETHRTYGWVDQLFALERKTQATNELVIGCRRCSFLGQLPSRDRQNVDAHVHFSIQSPATGSDRSSRVKRSRAVGTPSRP